MAPEKKRLIVMNGQKVLQTLVNDEWETTSYDYFWCMEGEESGVIY
jgi:hypothetical protein